MTTLICDCNQTMPLAPEALGAALNETLTLHSALCRRDAAAFERAAASGEPLVVACTQERRLFGELAQAAAPGSEAPLRFVNIREMGGWSRDAAQAGPKIAALLALAHLPQPEPVATVNYRSAGRTLVLGALDRAERIADLLADRLDLTLFVQDAGAEGGVQERRYAMLGGKLQSLTGWLGAFDFTWQRSNAIDLDLCTRCNACVVACPEGAIGLDYQVDAALCRSHRDCVKACGAAGAIDFGRQPVSETLRFDLVLDLRDAPAFSQHALPQGYFHLPIRAGERETGTLLRLRELVGEFEKPRFFLYRQKLCAHARNEKVGCRACVDVCSASAIESQPERSQVLVNPSLCVGCGACSTVCPSGALGYGYPRAGEQGVRIKTLLSTFARAGGANAALLLHSEGAGADLLAELGRAARLDSRPPRGGARAAGSVHGIPARVLPLALSHTASVGLELWLSALAYGACEVWVLSTGEEAPQYLEALRAQMDIGQAILSGLGYRGPHFRLLQARDARDLAQLDAQLQQAPAQGVARAAGFAVQAEKRATLELALDHLIACATSRPEAIALPAQGAPLGGLVIDKDSCTLCLSCVSACPSGALQDNPNAPQLGFIEKNCVQCGLCVSTCPEKSLALQPRLLLGVQRERAHVLNEAVPFACVRCARPFATAKGIEAMLGRLAGHSMFQGAALERLKMCGDCRVIDLHSSTTETRITDL